MDFFAGEHSLKDQRGGAPCSTTRRVLLGGLAGALLLPARLVSAQAPGAAAAAGGSFRGRVVAEWLRGGREMRLLEPFEYISSDGTSWPVPQGAIVDGASIPKVFWSVIGGPFEGPYREPSVIHDHYCHVRTRPFQDVHRVFHEAMLASGVGERRAWLMYKAVTSFGPSWSLSPPPPPNCRTVDDKYDFELCTRSAAPAPKPATAVNQDELNKFADEIEGEADSGDIEKLREAIRQM